MDNINKALNNISNGIEEYLKYFKEKNKNKSDNSEGKIFQNKDFTKFFESIKNGIKSIKKDTEKILKNQESLKHISKEKSKSTLFEKIGENTKKIKDGASTVVLIAAGILAIGLAFKIIGQVDFASVIALSIALPIVAIAFEKIAKLKGLKVSEMKNIFLVVGTIAASLVAASWLMNLIIPISITQGLTAIFISGIFYAITLNIEKLRNAVKDISNKDIINMSKVLLAITTTIMLSSWIMNLIIPISVRQGLTAILIAGTFVAIAYGMEKIVNSAKKIKANDIYKLPGILTNFAMAIMLSSLIMKLIIPISVAQGLTAILIAGTFTILAYGMEKIVSATKKIKASDIFELPEILEAFAISIMVSSWLFRAILPITFEQGLTAIAIAATLAVMSLSLPILALAVKYTSLKDAFLMTLILPLLATAIVATSYIFSKIKVIDSGVLLNIAEQSIALGISAIVLVGVAWVLSKIGLPAIIEGGLATVAIAGTIMASSRLLSKGTYEKYPKLDWAEGVGLSLLVFGLSALAFGLLIESGVEAVALIAGGVAVLGMAKVIMMSSHILSKGTYEKYPKLDWAEGVGLSLLAFGSSTMLLGVFILGTIGIGALALSIGAKAVKIISQSIVDSSFILGKGNYSGGPTKEWAEGISESIGAFAPVFKILYGGGILSIFKSVKISDLSDAITTISSGIVTAANYFNGAKLGDIWNGGPTKEWAEGVGGSIAAFAPVLEALSKSKGLFGSGPTPKEMNDAITNIANTIISVGKSFVKSGDIWTGGPTSDWSSNISGALSAFAPIFDYLNQNSGWFKTSNIDDLNTAITGIASSMVDAAKTLNDGKFINTIPVGYIQSMSDNIKAYVDLMSYLQDQHVSAFSFIDTMSVTYGLSQISNGYEKLSNTIKLLGNSINALDMEKLNSLKSFTGNIVLLSLMDSEQFEKMMTAFENKGGIFVKLMQELEEKTDKQQRYGTIGSVRNTSVTTNNTDTQILSALQTIARNTGETAKYSRSFSELMEELRYNNNNSLKDKKHYQ